jgi:hypothetical protein
MWRQPDRSTRRSDRNMSNGWNADIETRKWIQGMNTFAKKDHPRVVADSLNAPASAIEKHSRKNVERRLIVRTSFTLNSIRQDRQARGGNIDRMYSRVRTNSPYLAIQDQGGVIRAEGSKRAIPLVSSRTGQNIRKRIAKRYKINELGKLRGNPKFFMGKPRGGEGSLEFMSANVVIN